MNQQLPVESQLVSKLQICSMQKSFWAALVRFRMQPVAYVYLPSSKNAPKSQTYNLSLEELSNDPTLMQRRLELCHSAALALDKAKLCKYDRKSGALQTTSLGRVASHYYVGFESIATYNDYLKPIMSEIEIFRLFSLSKEFKFIHVREEEKLELAKLAGRVPIPVKEAVTEPSAKVNVLLQAYISNLKLDGFALVADLTFIRQSAARLMRCLLDIALKRGWAGLVEKTLELCKVIERRMWRSQSPLRQFSTLPDRIARLLERKDLPWERYYDLKPADLGELVKLPKMGKPLHNFIRKFPRLALSAHVQPITRSLRK